MHLLFTLLLAHLFADFPLQSNQLARLKRRSLKGVSIHVLIYVSVTALMLQQPLQYWPIIGGLGLVHFGIDAIKIFVNPKHEVRYFIFDQMLHFVSVVAATYIVYRYWNTIPHGILPDPLLYISFGFAFGLAFIVLCWIWANALSDEQIHQNVVLQWVKHQALLFEQRIGLALFAIIFVGQLVIKQFL